MTRSDVFLSLLCTFLFVTAAISNNNIASQSLLQTWKPISELLRVDAEFMKLLCHFSGGPWTVYNPKGNLPPDRVSAARQSRFLRIIHSLPHYPINSLVCWKINQKCCAKYSLQPFHLSITGLVRVCCCHADSARHFTNFSCRHKENASVESQLSENHLLLLGFNSVTNIIYPLNGTNTYVLPESRWIQWWFLRDRPLKFLA